MLLVAIDSPLLYALAEMTGEVLGKVDGVVGLQRGDEGKGRFVDLWAVDYPDIARYGGGPNAGHTILTPDCRTLKLHGIPSGIATPGKKNVIGDGVFIDAVKLVAEMEYLRGEGVEVSPENLLISSSAHLILPHHIKMDEQREGGQKGQGSTKSGIAFVDGDMAIREGVRAELINNDEDSLAEAIYKGLVRHGNVWLRLKNRFNIRTPGKTSEVVDRYVESALELGSFITDTMLFLNRELDSGRDVLAEGAQAFLLDKYQGMYPYTTSSITSAGGISPGLGIAPQKIDSVLGVAKSIHSHVGGGHFVTEATDESLLKRLHGDLNANDAEKGTTTGRVRRLGHIDLPQLRRANKVNGTSEIALTKLDWVSRYGETIPICIEYNRKGKRLKMSPNAGYKLEQSTPVYIELPGWSEDISDVREFGDLPKNARNYVTFLEHELDTPITMIGVGQERDQVIVRA